MSLPFAKLYFLSRLRHCREELKMSQKQAAKQFNIAERNWQKYESGETQPTIEKLIEIADFFNVSIDYLLGRSPNSEIDLREYKIKNEIYDTFAKVDNSMYNDIANMSCKKALQKVLEQIEKICNKRIEELKSHNIKIPNAADQ